MAKRRTASRKKEGVVSLFVEFFRGEKTGGLLLLFCTALSLLLANLSQGYAEFWQRPLELTFLGVSLHHSLTEWINEGLMTLFFLLVGLEIERELYIGKLSAPRNALLPVIAAAGGMAVPAAIHFFLNHGTPAQSGFGIPVATDIAFALGVLSFLGRGIPLSLKVLLTALAIIDDLGAILVIAIFYARDVSALHLGGAAVIYAILILLNRLGVNRLPVYIGLGFVMWALMLGSGVHATITGVLLAFAIPFREGREASPSCGMQRFLDGPVPLLVLPLFALANTAIVLPAGWHTHLAGPNQIGIAAGLFLGKPVGVVLAILIAVKAHLSALPSDLTWRHLTGVGFLCGIGFTMSIFIANLAFSDMEMVRDSKISILAASGLAAIVGSLVLLSADRTKDRKA